MFDYDPSLLDFMPKKKTLGQEVYEMQTKYAGQHTQNVRDTTNEMGKEYMASLRKVLEDHAHYTEPYYIMEIMKPDSHLEQVIRLYHIARKTRPKAEWGIALYKRDNAADTLTYEYGLPHPTEALHMMQNPSGWDKKAIQDIVDMVEGRLE